MNTPNEAIQEIQQIKDALDDDEYQIVTLLEERGERLRAEAIVRMSNRLWWGVLAVARAERG